MVNMQWEDGKVTWADIIAERDSEITIQWNEKAENLKFTKGEKRRL